MPAFRRHVPLVLIALAVGLAGCFQSLSTLTVRADGSATLVEVVALSDAALGFMAGAADSSRTDRAELEARAAALGPGVTLTDLRETDDGYTATFHVPDVRTLRLTMPDAPMGSRSDSSSSAPFTFAFRRGPAGGAHALDVIVPAPPPAAPDTAAADPERQRQGLAMARMLLGDARLTLRVEAEGTVEQTDLRDDTVLDVQMGALLDLLAEHPHLAGAQQPPLDEIARLSEGVEGLHVTPPGTYTVRFR